MDRRTIGIGIVAVALILAISMTASANPDPTGATDTVQSNNVTLSTYNVSTNATTDGYQLGEGVDVIYIEVTDYAVDNTNTTILYLNYTKEDGSTETLEEVWIPGGTQVGSWITESANITDLVDITGVTDNNTYDNCGNLTIVATVQRQRLYQGVGGTDSAKGGFVTEMDLDATSRTTRWQGYYGDVSGSIALADSQGHTMFSWAWDASKGGEVFATTNSSVPPWNSLAENHSTAFLSEINADWIWTIDATDDADATFNTTLASVTIADNTHEIVATTAGALGGASSQWQCGAIATTDPDEKDDFVFVGIMRNNNASFVTDTTVDYEMIVPTLDTGAALTYYFYMEMT